VKLLPIESKNRIFLHPDGYCCIEIVSNKYGLYYALIDQEDVPKVTNYRWSIRHTKYVTYVKADLRKNGQRKILSLHRLILPTDQSIDHIDGIGTNNLKSNLRPASPGENAANQRLSSRSTSGYRGVSLSKITGKYRATIQHQLVKFFMGEFLTAKEAARAWDIAATILFGAFARLNFPAKTAIE
jgi:hypothetical protein